ncbi:RNA polymerase-binding protein DksA [Pacificimonas pallii]|nr:RNA polymerase-binding protein DksA [Pacificimonas pallii]
MCDRQLAYFRRKLISWRDELQQDAQETRDELAADSLREPDLSDRASAESDWTVHLRKRDRARKLVSKINAALRRIETGEYGLCEVTGEPIGLGRLDARPTATMTVEAQEAHERTEKVSRD